MLAPDNLGRHLPRPGRGYTLGTPSGTQALRRTERVLVTYRDREALIARPNLVGALLIKAAANARTKEARHLQDVVNLAELLRRNDIDAASLTNKERKRLKRVQNTLVSDHRSQRASENLVRLLNSGASDSRPTSSSPPTSATRSICGHRTLNGRPCNHPRPPQGSRCAAGHRQ